MNTLAYPNIKPAGASAQRAHFARVRALLRSFIAADRHRFADGTYKPLHRLVFDLRCEVGESTVYEWLQQDHPQVLEAQRAQHLDRRMLKSMQRLGITDDDEDSTTTVPSSTPDITTTN